MRLGRNSVLGGNKSLLGFLFLGISFTGVVLGSVNVFATCNGQSIRATSRFEPRICITASVDNGATYGPISSVLKDYLIQPTTLSDKAGAFSGDCLTSVNGQNGWVYYGIDGEKIPYDNIKVKVNTYLRWVDFRGQGFGAVDYRIMSTNIADSWNTGNNQNVLIGFCRNRNSSCPTFNQSIIDGTYRNFSNSPQIISSGNGEVEILPTYGPYPNQPWVWTFDTRSIDRDLTLNYGITIPNRTQSQVSSDGRISVRRCLASDNDDNCGCSFVANNTFVQIRYVAQRYQNEGLAEVYEGESIDAGKNHASTDWRNTSATADTVNIDCEDSGCYATFKLALRNKLNNGKTVYGVTRQKNSENVGNVATTPGSPFTPGINGTLISTGVSDTYTAKEFLKPGDQVCYFLNFDPREVNNVTLTTLKVCAKAKTTTFKGKSTLSGTVSRVIDWRDTDDAVTVPIENCSPIYGCTVKFKQELRRESGLGVSNYVVSRTSNLTDNNSSRAIPSNNNLASGIFPKGAGTIVYESGDISLYPGMVVCDQLSFDANNSANSPRRANLKICASALGDAQPPEPDPDAHEDPDKDSGDLSLINIKVRNSDVDAYKDYQREVYAKPSDNVFYRGTYNPVLQYTYYIKSKKITIGSDTTMFPGEINSDKILGTLFNENYVACRNEKVGCWNNAYSVFSAGLTPSFNDNFTYKAGDTSRRSTIKDHKVMGSEAGSSLSGKIKLNNVDGTKTTASQVTFVSISDMNVGQIKTDSKEQTAYVRVPYNFTNDTYIDSESQNKLYAGESVDIKYAIDVNPRENTVTDGTYATIVRNAKWKLELCYEGNCVETNPSSGNLNSSYNYDGKKGEIKNTTIVIPDVDAGTEMCLRSAVFPANSGDERNYSDKNYSNTWKYSERVCYKVAKRPNMQIWGGSIYSARNVSVPISAKKHVYGFNEYSINTDNPYIVFGSWGELEVVASGRVSGLASGAGTGYARNNNGSLWPSYNSNNASNSESLSNYGPGGNVDGTMIQYCLRSTLSFANTQCSSGYVGNFGGMSQASVSANKNTLISRFVGGGDSSIDYSEVSDNTIIPNENFNGMVEKGITKVIKANGKLTINGNLSYADGYSTLEDIPKLILYATGDITIGCNVSRIDAVLISDGDINTCNSADINASENSNQLIINGSVITNTLTLNRTYGAAKGANSIIPAEIINYDATLYLWGANQTSVSASAKFDSVYTREVAPRY